MCCAGVAGDAFTVQTGATVGAVPGGEVRTTAGGHLVRAIGQRGGRGQATGMHVVRDDCFAPVVHDMLAY